MITKERFSELLNNALKKRKIGKPDRDKFIAEQWDLVITKELSADWIIDREETITRKFLAEQKKAKAVPLESDEQIQFVSWFRATYPDDLIYAVPNGDHRDIRTAVKLKAEGVTKGIADLKIEWRNGKNTAIEMKRQKGGVQSDDQKWYQKYCEDRGDNYLLCLGFDDAKKQILEFIK